LGAMAIGFLPIGHVLLLDIAGAFIAVVSLLFVRIPVVKEVVKTKVTLGQVFQDMTVAYQEIRKSKGLSLLFLYCAIAGICIMPISVLLPLMTMHRFDGGKWEMGIVETVWGGGALLGGSILSMVNIRFRKIHLVYLAHILLGFAFLVLAFLSKEQFVLFILLVSMGGISAALYNSGFTATVQEMVQPHLLGRVFALYYSFDVLPTVIALAGTSFVVHYIGLNILFAVLGAIVLAIGIISYFTPSFRTMR